MDFRNLLAKYKDGEATQEEIQLVEEELKKYEAIEEYLSQDITMEFEKKEYLQENTKEETTFIKNRVNKKLAKVVVISVITVFLILFSVFYVISPIVSSFYYNPSQSSVSGGHQDLYFDLKVITELNLPGYAIGGGVISESLGFGTHMISFERKDVFSRETIYINTKIRRDMKVENFYEIFPKNYLEFYSLMPTSYENKVNEELKNNTITYIKALNPVSYISAYIVFAKDLTLKEFNTLQEKYNNKVTFSWVGVRSEEANKGLTYLTGFNPNYNDGSVSSDSADKNKYPYLQLVDWVTDENNYNKHDMVQAYTKHYISLLTYMKERERAVKVLDINGCKSDYYKNALEYVENNGISTYGGLVRVEAKDLLEFLKNEKVKEVGIKNVLVSKYRY